MFSLLVPIAAHASISDDIAAKQRQIDELQRQIDAYQAQANDAGQVSQTLQSEIAKLNAQIGQISAQIRQLNASIDKTGLEVDQTVADIGDAEHKLDLHQKALAQYLRITDQNDQQSLALVLLKNSVLSDFFDYVHNIQRTQDNLRLTIRSVMDLRENLDQRRDDLQGQKADLERMRALQQVQQRDLASTKGTKNTILKETKGQEAKFQQLVKQSKQDLARLQEEIYYLQQNGITVQDAVKYGQLAAIGAGIRPAFLLALLEIESRLGLNVGTGNWQDDMYLCYIRLSNIARTAAKRQFYINRAETEKNAFMSIMGALGLDPNTVKVSHEPSYGCGGAMGPAQFIPSTWLGYAPDVSRLTGRATASPWNTEDAFTAAAIKLARAGAISKDRAGELAAARAYIGGSPNCSKSICNYYANTVLKKAAEIQQNL